MYRHFKNIMKESSDFPSEVEDIPVQTRGEAMPLLNGKAKGMPLLNHSRSRSNSLLTEELPGHSKDANLMTCKAIVLISFWYFFSFTTLFMNKYILSYQKGDPTVLGITQLWMCALFGHLHMRFPCGLYRKTVKENKPSFSKNILVVGTLRYTTVLLGLIALWYVPVSFAETIKSSAPLFTVGITRLIIGEKTTWRVVMSLFPVMGGLFLCSAYELSFSWPGLLASLATNLSECFQNVFSKVLLSGEKQRYEAPELQFYTSIASLGIQLPACLLLIDSQQVYSSLNWDLVAAYLLDGISFHCQSLTEYMLLGLISPVSHSVANTTKRALLIWLSVLVFGNPVTFLSGLGTATVIFGVFCYNKARQLSLRAGIMPIPATSADNHHQV